MSLIAHDVTAEATKVAARLRLARIDEVRTAGEMDRQGYPQREIARALSTTQPRAGRLVKMAKEMDPKPTPEEMILEATVNGSDREALIGALSRRSYTVREDAPWPSEGATPGTWDQVRWARSVGLLTEKEYSQIASRVGPSGS